MRLYKIILQYFLLISFCYCHDLNHADPVTVKQAESSVTIDPLSKTIETTNVQKNDNENARLQDTDDFKKLAQNSNEQQIQSTTPSVPISSENLVPVSIQNDLTSPFTPVQTQINSQTVDTIQQNQLKEETSFTHTQSHIPSHSNSNPLDLKSDQDSQIPLKSTQTTTTSDTSIVENESHPSRTVRSSTPKYPQNAHVHPRNVQINQEETEDSSIIDANPSENSTVETSQQSITLENKTQTNGSSVNNTDLPNPKSTLKPNVSSTKDDSNKNEIENVTTTPSVSVHDTNAHLPRVFGNETSETVENISQTNDNNTNETNPYFIQTESKMDEGNHSILVSSNFSEKNRQICWRLPKKFEPSIELLENQIFRFINVLPEFLQTIFFGPINDREILMNTMWFGSICTMCFLFSFCFLSMGTKRLKQSKYEKEVRARCQQLQQYNNQIELERATFERQNQKLSDEIDELKNLPVRDTDEDIFALRTECIRCQEETKTVRMERDTLQQDIDQKQNLIQKYEYDMKGQVEIVAHLNNQILQLKQELEKERGIVSRLQSNDFSLERFEKSQEIIQELKSEITQLKQEKFIQKDQLQEIQEHSNQLDIENNQLTLRMKQLKNLFQQRDQTIKHLYEKIQTIDHFESEDLLSILTENSSDNNNQDFLSIIDNDIQKSNQHIHDLHSEINEKTRRIKELDLLFKQEKDHCKEIETKLKIVLELRERDAHLHIRQLGQTDAELRKARTDTERIRILQHQLELKQQQLDDIQKVVSSEQIKFNEECSKLQHETHEKWMEVKRLTRELDGSKKECEGLRRQITKYANKERSSQEKTTIKLVPQNFGESETNSSSPIPYQQGENFRPIDQQRNDSGAMSPVEMLIPRPPLFGLSRPPFFPPPFMHPPPSNPFIMHPRFPIPPGGPHGMLSPISHLITNGSDANSSEIIDSSNITPNSTSYDAQLNGGVVSPLPDDEKQIKPKKAKKSLKKKTRTSVVKEDV